MKMRYLVGIALSWIAKHWAPRRRMGGAGASTEEPSLAELDNSGICLSMLVGLLMITGYILGMAIGDEVSARLSVALVTRRWLVFLAAALVGRA